jgi:hypothetical protein
MQHFNKKKRFYLQNKFVIQTRSKGQPSRQDTCPFNVIAAQVFGNKDTDNKFGYANEKGNAKRWVGPNI